MKKIDRIKILVGCINILGKCCEEALNEEWDKSDSGFKDMLTLIDETLSKTDLHHLSESLQNSDKLNTIDNNTDTIGRIVYTTESGTDYTWADVMNIAKGNERLADILLDLAEWQHIETIFQELVMEGEIDEEGNILEQD